MLVNSQRRSKWSGITAVLGTTLIAACSREPVRVAVVMGLDGVSGARIAADEVNAAGGVRGRPIELAVVTAFQTSAREALVAADSISRDPTVVAVVGHANSSASIAASQVYNSARVVQIAPTSTAPLYRSAGAYSYRMVAGDEHQAGFLVADLTRDGRRPRTAVLYVNDDYGRLLRNAVVQRLRTAGVPLVHDAPYVEGDAFTDLESIVREMTRHRPDVLLWLGRGTELRRVLPPLRRTMPRLEVLASDGIGSACCIPSARDDLRGVRYARIVDPTGVRPALVALRVRYQELTKGSELTDQAALTHDAILLIAHVINSGGTDRESIRESLAKVGRGAPAFMGATGAFAFDSAGDPEPRYFVDTVRAPSLSPAPVVSTVPRRP